MECLKTIWNQASCAHQGRKFPANLTEEEMNYVNALNLVYDSYVVVVIIIISTSRSAQLLFGIYVNEAL